MLPEPTHRAVLDPTRVCPLRCSFCYYHHERQAEHRPVEALISEIENHASQGCEAVDITGGEPLTYPFLIAVLDCCREHKLGVRIITSLTGPQPIFEAAVKRPVSWLVSMHGPSAVHDKLVGRTGARFTQHQRIPRLNKWDVNCVINQQNQEHILGTAEVILQAKAKSRPRVVNFINFNPHRGWAGSTETNKMVADLTVVYAQLDAAIELLERNNVAVNVRYFPLCRIPLRYRRTVCNDLHVAFDSGEWWNDIPKPVTLASAAAYGVRLSNRNELKTEPCASCALRMQCGGVNKHWYTAALQVYGDQLLPEKGEPDDTNALLYRQYNAVGLVPYH